MGTGGAGGIGLAGEIGQLGLGGEGAGRKVPSFGGEMEGFTEGGIFDQDDGFIFPPSGFLPKGEDELAGADFPMVRQRDGISPGEGGGEFLGKGEEGFDASAMLDEERVVSRVVFGERRFVLGQSGAGAQAEAEKKEREKTDHRSGAWGRFPTKVEHGEDTGDHEQGAAPFQKPAWVVKNLQSGAVEVLRVPACLGEFVGEAGDLREESRGVGGGLVHFELGGHFDLLFFISEGDGGEEVGRLVGSGVAWDVEGVESDGEGEIL